MCYSNISWDYLCRLFDIETIIASSLPTKMLSVILGILSSCLFLHECKKLDGYDFPVYTTEFCPRNQSEWSERSSSINCSKSNGYLCLPNENITELLEFCYIYPFLWIEEELISKQTLFAEDIKENLHQKFWMRFLALRFKPKLKKYSAKKLQ